MEVLVGLPIDGEPVIGTTNEDWGPLCRRLLGLCRNLTLIEKMISLLHVLIFIYVILMFRWDDRFRSPDLATHVVGYYRNYFDMQRSNKVIWRPYSEELIDSLPPNCRVGKAIWMAKVPLLNFPMVQMHMPDREHRAELEMWNNRLDHIVPAGEADPYEYAYPADDPYVSWYERMTIQYISRLGGGANKVMRLFERLRTVQIMEDIDLDELRSIREEGVGAMAFLEKWLRKRLPMEANQSQAGRRECGGRGLDTTFLGRPVLKRKETLDGDDGGSLDAPQLGDDLVGMGGHPMVKGDVEVHAELDVQGEQGEGEGVVTQAHVMEQEVQEDQDGTRPFVPRRSQRQPHPAACGTGSHKLFAHHFKRRKDK
ncbi:hypothetical protein RHMOL_Rhmol04G0139600 [Rhododendron molle]|uniref:Uncharacterized protein n=1 Tax=Rhododendron molle TaxID=49168 RepID=A0ACC0P1G9_RHOML|nr:hypothetical protein RHMOL_Rhmol04G0139600 [Rhododendron molle]